MLQTINCLYNTKSDQYINYAIVITYNGVWSVLNLGHLSHTHTHTTHTGLLYTMILPQAPFIEDGF